MKVDELKADELTISRLVREGELTISRLVRVDKLTYKGDRMKTYIPSYHIPVVTNVHQPDGIGEKLLLL